MKRSLIAAEVFHALGIDVSKVWDSIVEFKLKYGKEPTELVIPEIPYKLMNLSIKTNSHWFDSDKIGLTNGDDFMEL